MLDRREETARFAQLLETRNVSTRRLAIGALNVPPQPDIVESLGLSRAWSRPWTARALRERAEFQTTILLHVLQYEWDKAAIALAESWGVPYLLNVDEFPSPGDRIRLSKRWCRGLIASCGDLAAELCAGLPGVPISVVSPAFHVREPIDRDPSTDRVRVVGAAGPLTTGSDMGTFLEAARILVDDGADAEFVIAGDGPDEFELRRLAEHLGIADRVTFTGDADPDAAFSRMLDVFCQTATRPTAARSLALSRSRTRSRRSPPPSPVRALRAIASARLAPRPIPRRWRASSAICSTILNAPKPSAARVAPGP